LRFLGLQRAPCSSRISASRMPASLDTGYLMEHEPRKVLMQPAELLIIAGAERIFRKTGCFQLRVR